MDRIIRMAIDETNKKISLKCYSNWLKHLKEVLDSATADDSSKPLVIYIPSRVH